MTDFLNWPLHENAFDHAEFINTAKATKPTIELRQANNKVIAFIHLDKFFDANGNL